MGRHDSIFKQLAMIEWHTKITPKVTVWRIICCDYYFPIVSLQSALIIYLKTENIPKWCITYDISFKKDIYKNVIPDFIWRYFINNKVHNLLWVPIYLHYLLVKKVRDMLGKQLQSSWNLSDYFDSWRLSNKFWYNTKIVF